MENRVNELRKLVPAEYWKHYPGKENLADVPSRGITPAELASCKLWIHTPDWLVDMMTEFNEDNLLMPEECLKETRITNYNLMCSSPATNGSNNLGNIICCENFSRLRRLLRVTAYVIRFVELCKSKLRGTDVGTKTEELTAVKAEILGEGITKKLDR